MSIEHAIIEQVAAALGDFRPQVGLVLGSGLGDYAERELRAVASIDYDDLPGFPRSTVPGHRGRFVAGFVGAVPVLCMQGRVHFYEGYPMSTVTLPTRVIAGLGAQCLILTNAAGGIHPDFHAGDLMLIRDHINFMGTNPLIGPNRDPGPRFPDLSHAWDPQLISVARNAARELDLVLREGVYLAVTGPSFETPAEIRAFRTLGADAVGMSTVPECIVARHAGMRVMGISCITNLAAGLSDAPLTHEEVGQTAARVRDSLARLLNAIIRGLASQCDTDFSVVRHVRNLLECAEDRRFGNAAPRAGVDGLRHF